MSMLRIGDLVELPEVRTVVQLADGRTRAAEIANSFVFTGDVYAHLAALAEILSRETGRGIFLQGEFGSGKSHFLAALALWLDEREGCEALTRHHSGLQRLRSSQARLLTVEISLLMHRGTRPLEQIVVEAVEAALAAHGHAASLTPLSNFLRAVERILEQAGLTAAFAEFAHAEFASLAPRDAYALSLRFLQERGLDHPESLVEDRQATFERVEAALADAGYEGMVLIVDELSEFFRSKPSAAALNEDARLLQFLGERADERPLWIIAAVQESIERTGDIAQATFRKIKDRFPIRFALSTVHIRDLIAQRLVRRKPGSNDALLRLHGEMRQHFPSFDLPFDVFLQLYPVHPLTLSLLEGLGDLFSQHRGIVDFVRAQVAGDAERGIPGILDRPAAELLAPDAIYEHFVPRLAEFSSFHVYPRHIMPHLDAVAEAELEPEDAALAKRLLRMLVLFTIHPTTEVPDDGRLAELASCMLAPHNPALNAEFVAEAILQPIAAQSQFLVRQEGRFAIVTDTDHGATWRARVARAAADFADADTRLVTLPLAVLPATSSWPGPDLLRDPQERLSNWQRSERPCVVMLRVDESDPCSPDLAAKLARGSFAFGLVIDFLGGYEPPAHVAVWRVALAAEHLPLLKEYAATVELMSALRPGNPADVPLIPIATQAHERLQAQARHSLLDAIYAGEFANLAISVDAGFRTVRNFERLPEMAAAGLLAERYPNFRQIAPRSAPAASRHYERLLDELITPASLSLSEARKRGIHELIESLVVPLGLAEVHGGKYRVAPDPGKHRLLAAVFEAIPTAGASSLEAFLAHLQQGPFGLTAEMAAFLTVALAHSGLLTLLKGGRVLPLEFLHLHNLDQAEKIAPGEMIAQRDRETLLQECSFLAPKGGWSSFGLRQQRDAWQDVLKQRERWQRLLTELQQGLARLTQFANFASLGEASWHSSIAALSHLCDAIRPALPAREGLEAFLEAWRGTGLSMDDIELIARVREFCERDYEGLLFAAHYLDHQSVRAGTGADEWAALRRALAAPEDLIASGELRAFEARFDAFRRSYAAAYEAGHAQHYAAAGPPLLSTFGHRALRQLKRLLAITGLDRPLGLTELIQELTEPKVAVCQRVVAQELMRGPICNCGYQLGELPLARSVANPEQALADALAAYAEILRRPEIDEALVARAYALRDLDGEQATRLQGLAQAMRDESTPVQALCDMLDAEACQELNEALRQRLRVEPRDLEALHRSLSGRRLTPAAIRQHVEAWLGDAAPDQVLAIEGGFTSGEPKADWWPLLHRDCLELGGEDERQEQMRRWQGVLDRYYPATSLANTFANLRTPQLQRFVEREPVHTAALQRAWSVLAERVLSGEPLEAGEAAAHLLHAPEVDSRLAALAEVAARRQAEFPQRLMQRLPIAALLADSWTTNDLRRLLWRELEDLRTASTEWAASLPPVSADLSGNTVMLVVDAVPADVWLAVADALPDAECDLRRLDVPTTTVASIAVRLGSEEDPTLACQQLGIPYHHLDGGESQSVSALLPPLPPTAAVLVRIAFFDRAVHAGSLPLSAFPSTLRAMLARQILPWVTECRERGRPVVLTSDHGCSLSPKGLRHGDGQTMERLIFSARWE